MKWARRLTKMMVSAQVTGDVTLAIETGASLRRTPRPEGLWASITIVGLLCVACGSGESMSQAAPPAFLVTISYPERQQDGTVQMKDAPHALDPQSNYPYRRVNAASVSLVVEAVGRPYLEAEGWSIPESVANTVDESRRLRDQDEGFYRVEQMVPGPTSDPTPRWTIVYEPHSEGLMARPFNLYVLNGENRPRGTSLQLRLLFVPPDAPANVSVTRPDTNRRRVDWSDESNSETGFDILVSGEITGGYHMAGRVGPNVRTFFTIDKSVVPQNADNYWQVCARGAPLPRCSPPVRAEHIGTRASLGSCDVSLSVPVVAEQSLVNPSLYHVTVPELGVPYPVGKTFAAEVTGVTNPSSFAIRVRDRTPAYRDVPAGGSISFNKPIMEGPWTVSVPMGPTPLPTTIPFTLSYCF